MHYYRKIETIILDIGHIFEPAYKVPRRNALFFAYLKIRIKASLNRFFHFKTERFLGFLVTVPDYDIFLAIFRQVFVRNVYYFEAAGGAPTIIDCGGNIGMTLLYWKYLYPAAKITVFEPSREVIDVLKQNLAQNNITDVRIVNAAVSDREGKATIYVRGAAACGNTLSSSIKGAAKRGADADSYEVDTLRLSPFMTEAVDMLKMDIEGAEGAVVRELADTDALKRVKEVAMEYHYYPAEAANDLANLLKSLQKGGFESQFYFEEYDATQQLAFSRDGSYSTMLRATKHK